VLQIKNVRLAGEERFGALWKAKTKKPLTFKGKSAKYVKHYFGQPDAQV